MLRYALLLSIASAPCFARTSADTVLLRPPDWQGARQSVPLPADVCIELIAEFVSPACVSAYEAMDSGAPLGLPTTYYADSGHWIFIGTFRR